MVDRYSGYKAMDQVKQGDLALAFCWAYVRRDFVRVGKGYPELTPWALQWIDAVHRRRPHSFGQQRQRANDSQSRGGSQELLRQRIGVVWSLGDDVVLDFRDAWSLENQSIELADLVL